ncbi:MAG: glycosyltransferase family 4 protein [Cyclobacteriaceae bacterium]
MKELKKKVVVVGQTPPPYHGQAMMIEKLVNTEFDNIEIYHIRMSYSSQIDEIGRISIRKILHLFYLIFKTHVVFWKFKPSVLVYYPVGNRLGGVLRDWVYLLLTRGLFKKLVLNFQAAGLGEYIWSFNPLFRRMLCFPFMKPDLSILLTEGNPRDDQRLQSKRTAFIPNGIDDLFEEYRHLISSNINDDNNFNCIYLGMVKESKGVTDLIKGIDYLVNVKKFTRVQLRIVGSFASKEYETKVKNYVEHKSLVNYIIFEGLQVGDRKWEYLLNSDVLCFPTFFEKESFGNVIIEGFMMSKPVIGSNWRGTSTIIDDGLNGIIVDVHDYQGIGDAILQLSADRSKLQEMSSEARKKFINKYTLKHHLDMIEASLMSI